jgi:dolichol-phosphate mannosyltransferase
MKLSIIIPAYNEEKTLVFVVENIRKVFIDIPYEIIIVDDGSTDATENIAKNMSDSHTHVIRESRNKGKGNAIRRGISVATGDFIAIQDADLEYNPAVLRMLWDSIKDPNSIVYGKRSRNIGYVWNRIANAILSYTCNLLYGSKLFDIYTGYKIIPRNLVRNLDLKSNGFEIEAEITAKLLKQKYLIKEIQISYNPRTKREGKKIRAWDGCVGLWTLIMYRF